MNRASKPWSILQGDDPKEASSKTATPRWTPQLQWKARSAPSSCAESFFFLHGSEKGEKNQARKICDFTTCVLKKNHPSWNEKVVIFVECGSGEGCGVLD